MRLCEARFQHNECPVESIISSFISQAFRGQHEDTAENRAIIKVNGDSVSGAFEFCDTLAEMSYEGLPEWGIQKLTLPITFGRYHNALAKSFAREETKKGRKFNYMYNCNSEAFSINMKKITETFQEVDITEQNDD